VTRFRFVEAEAAQFPVSLLCPAWLDHAERFAKLSQKVH